jgi:hypothetical protein
MLGYLHSIIEAICYKKYLIVTVESKMIVFKSYGLKRFNVNVVMEPVFEFF